MNIEWIEITGLRGFFEKSHIDLALPNGNICSGLNVFIGPNNSGKTTIIEAFHAISKNSISISEDKRNKFTNDKVIIYFKGSDGKEYGIETIDERSSEVNWINSPGIPKDLSIFVLRSRRVFNPFFSKNYFNRDTYVKEFGYEAQRPREEKQFYGRLFNICKSIEEKNKFNADLKKLLDYVPNWTIDQNAAGSYYLKINYPNFSHSSDGLGEGIVSLFLIVDALYDSEENQIIVIDEPELSLHPHLQNKLNEYLSEYAKKHQIIIATHNPNFISWDTIKNGRIIRTSFNDKKGIKIFSLSDEAKEKLILFERDLGNIHIMGKDAKETLFLEDKVVLLEGQEDVYYYKYKILPQLGMNINGEFFGWGVGGASNMNIICKMLSDLGYQKVAGILDKGKEDEFRKLKQVYINYLFFLAPASDVRRGEMSLVDEQNNIRKEFDKEVIEIIENIKKYFNK